MPLEFEPGTKYSYSNSNYNVLARVIEKVSGKTFGEFLQENIFQKCGMDRSGHPDDELLIVENKANGYMPLKTSDLQKSPYLNWTSKTGNGSLYSTVDDLSRFARRFFKGDLVKAATREKMLSEHLENVGYGWFIRPRHKRKQYHINGRSPGFTSVLSYYPEEDLTMVVLANNYAPLATQIGIDLAAMVLGESYENILPENPKELETRLDQYVGEYQFGDNFYVANFRLKVVLEGNSLKNQWGGLIPKAKDAFIQRLYWSNVHFERDKKGRVVKMVFDGFEGKKI